jgi:hypothetical protein
MLPHIYVIAHIEQTINLHEQTQHNITAANAKYQVAGSKGRKLVPFELGDMVWLHLIKDCFCTLHHSKMMHRDAGPCIVLTKINDNAFLTYLRSLVFPLVLMLHILNHTRVKMRSCHRGRLQFKKGRMMRTPHVHLLQQQLGCV